jgi:hypothetical protein
MSALTFLVALAGCNHTAGVCDCDPCSHSCCCSCAGMGYHSASGAYFAPTPVGPAAPAATETAPPPAAKVGEPIKEPEKAKEAEKEPAKEATKDKPKEE